ncbi:putative ABC O-antigen/lipopolysaccharide exporter, ATPase subunit [Pseudorhizobium banfieldiae]|uniref:Putative ABC O-antigen/lipopolysaccharide exporter, ATPase subunit n=1 Tax=Pseudorhizobium banfieldiae TaxID=1125847 RepID=L0NBP2_9HYPH|nr:ABC transporter ATP-binding protein [Pseudorhizobium banfieldiae]CAD6601851.1 ABC transporter ATP-binding protein [arsenite-oxidising bacterium NT-25]CCF18299.1 putative ABC O-antigen/lipopolysaccharide exporter, ATPase subunit [Pseudorhizobium banfieldiae]
MSSEPYIRASGLGKRFRLYDRSWHYFSNLAFGTSFGREYRALAEVNLDLRPGDCLGIVGRNGAGKSTLLELICGILTPSEGTIETRGRIAALLQLGAGFNPDFTGRENVFLAASLYGLSGAEVAERFSAIETFAGIGSFIERPVREYSSGMYARLAFSVCAHVDADIFVVDEALGVGDVKFQQQSMKLLRGFRRKGIVLFVSHDEHAVAALCNRAIWIDAGRIVASGATKEVLYRYRRDISQRTGEDRSFIGSDETIKLSEAFGPDLSTLPAPPFDPNDVPPVDQQGVIDKVALQLADGSQLRSVEGGEHLSLRVACRSCAPIDLPHLIFVLRDPMGQIVFAGDSRAAGVDPINGMQPGDHIDCKFDFMLPYLPTGSYPIEVFFLSSADECIACHDHIEIAAVIEVLSNHVSSGIANLRMERTLLIVEPESACGDG